MQKPFDHLLDIVKAEHKQAKETRIVQTADPPQSHEYSEPCVFSLDGVFRDHTLVI